METDESNTRGRGSSLGARSATEFILVIHLMSVIEWEQEELSNVMGKREEMMKRMREKNLEMVTLKSSSS